MNVNAVRVRSQSLLVTGLLIVTIALLSRCQAIHERPPPLWVGKLPAQSPLTVDRSRPAQPALEAPLSIGPAGRLSTRGSHADPVSATTRQVELTDGGLRKVLRIRHVFDWPKTRWTFQPFVLRSGATVLAGKASNPPYPFRGLAVEAAVEGRSLALPSFAPLLTDSRIWPRRRLNDIRYQLNHHLYTAKDYTIEGIYVATDCIYVMVVWHATLSSYHEPVATLLARLTPSAAAWQVEVTWAKSDSMPAELPAMVTFTDGFFIFDQRRFTWFDSNGLIVREVPWTQKDLTWVGSIECESGLLVLRTHEDPSRDLVICTNPWTGRVVRSFYP